MRTHEHLGGMPPSTFKREVCYRLQYFQVAHDNASSPPQLGPVFRGRGAEKIEPTGAPEADLRMIEFAEDLREHAPMAYVLFMSSPTRSAVSLITSWKWRMSRCCPLSNMMFSVLSRTPCPNASVPLRPTIPLCFLVLFHDSRCSCHLNQPRHGNSMHSKGSLQGKARDKHYCGQDCRDLGNFPTSNRIDFLRCSRHARAIGQCGGSLRGRV